MSQMLHQRYVIVSEIINKYANFRSKSLKYYSGIDTLHNNQNVIIEIYKLPKNSDSQLLAITYWEREVRLTRKALALDNSESLLKLIDAFVDRKNQQLVIVFKKFGNALFDWIEKVNDSFWLNSQEEKNRKEIWNLILKLCKGLNSLHNGKILHRNINPTTLYYSDEIELPQMRFGGFSWGVYLYNLQDIEKNISFQNLSYSIFNPSEIIYKKNAFSFDIYSIGIIIAYIFCEHFPETEINNSNEWKNAYQSIISQIKNLSYLFPSEKNIILSCISENYDDCYKSVQSVIDSINVILTKFEPESLKIENLDITWWNELESPFIKKLSNTSINLTELLFNPNIWLKREFSNSKLYVTGIKDHPLVVVTEKHSIYGLRPIKTNNFRNEDLANLYLIYGSNSKKLFTAILDKNPLYILKNGFNYVSNSKMICRNWKKIHLKSRQELKKSQEEKSREDLFQDSLSIMFEAEKKLDLNDMLKFKFQYERPLEKKINGKNKEYATIIVAKNFDEDENPIGKERKEIENLLLEYKNEYGGIIELSPSNDPSSDWDNGREWKISKINIDKFEISIEREKYKRNKRLDYEGVIRPSKMSRSLSLYRRKKFIIEDIKENHLLLSALLFPKLNSFYLGIEDNEKNPIIREILNTMPLFLVQGPPGCGKTWTASTIVAKIIEKDPFARILISSKDHEPLDHLVENVIEKIPSRVNPYPLILRLISPDREKFYTKGDFILEYSKQNRTTEMMKMSLNNLDKNLPKSILISWGKLIRENIANPQTVWMDEIVKAANIVFATSTSSSIDWLKKNASSFDYVILEEAAKSYPLELLLPMNLGYRWLLIGDQKQLPPYKYNDMLHSVIEIIDEDLKELVEINDDLMNFREECVSEIKLFEKLYDDLEKTNVIFSTEIYHPCTRLETNWRFPPVISKMISLIFYDTIFENKNNKPDDGIPFIKPNYLAENELIWIDTPYCLDDKAFVESRDSSASIFNVGEVKILEKLLNAMVLNNLIPKNELDMVIITPYKAQQEMIINRIRSYQNSNINSKKLSKMVHTVDSYQGRQADIIIISLARNNDYDNITSSLGFLTYPERLNVMFSRVKKRMIIIGCSELIKKFQNREECQEINKIYQYISKHGQIVSIQRIGGI